MRRDGQLCEDGGEALIKLVLRAGENWFVSIPCMPLSSMNGRLFTCGFGNRSLSSLISTEGGRLYLEKWTKRSWYIDSKVERGDLVFLDTVQRDYFLLEHPSLEQTFLSFCSASTAIF